MGGTLSLHLVTGPSVCGTHFHNLLRNLTPPVIQYILIASHHQTQMDGSETRRVVYSIGYPRTAAQAFIHLLSWQFLPNLTFDQFHLLLRTLPLEPIGPKLSAINILSLSLFCTLRLYFDLLIAFDQRHSIPLFLSPLNVSQFCISVQISVISYVLFFPQQLRAIAIWLIIIIIYKSKCIVLRRVPMLLFKQRVV